MVAALILGAAFCAVYGVIAGSVPRTQGDAVDLLGWERWTHLDPGRVLKDALQHLGVLAVPAYYFYAVLYFIVTPAVLLWAYHARPGAYRSARTVLAVVTGSALIANQFAAMPRLHMAWAAWCGANHYLVDVVAGGGLWLFADLGVRHLARSKMTKSSRVARAAAAE